MIVRHPDKRLRTLCATIADPTEQRWADLAKKLDEWRERGDQNGPGLGLAAPQLGECVQMFVVVSYPMPFINPILEWSSPERAVMSESCISIPFARVAVERPTQVTLRAQNLAGVWKKWKLRGMTARIAQHELDHLNGVLILDHALEEGVDAA